MRSGVRSPSAPPNRKIQFAKRRRRPRGARPSPFLAHLTGSLRGGGSRRSVPLPVADRCRPTRVRSSRRRRSDLSPRRNSDCCRPPSTSQSDHSRGRSNCTLPAPKLDWGLLLLTLRGQSGRYYSTGCARFPVARRYTASVSRAARSQVNRAAC